MNSIQFDVTPYNITAVSLFIVGMASTLYLLHIKEKSVPAWIMIFGLASFTASMITMLMNSIVFWGGALGPSIDAFSVVSMAAMVEFAYRFPYKATSVGSRLVRVLTLTASLAALTFSFYYAVQVLAFHNYFVEFPTAYGYLNPLTFLVALGVSAYRTISMQTKRSHSVWGVIDAFVHPQDRPARLMRNFSLALSIGLVQGIASGIGLPDFFPPLVSVILINLSLLLMLVAVVYASFDFTARQPSLVVRLVGLSLVTLLTVLGVIGLYNSNLTMGWILDRNASVVENTRKALHAGHPESMPVEVVYVLSWPLDSQNGAASQGRLVAARQPGFDPQPLFREGDVPPVWVYYLEGNLSTEAAQHGDQIRLRYGDHPVGSYHQYAGLVFNQDGMRYEVGLSLAELSRITQDENTGIIWGVLCSALFILFVFPLFFRSNLIRPLDRLLAGVRQADAGDLDVQVRVTHNDEVGFLTSAFNKMITSLQRELDGRQKAEAELRHLNLTLEERVANRTRELEAMYDLSAASNLARDPQSLFSVLLERSLYALRTPLGFIILFENHGERQDLKRVASQNLPPNWLPYFSALHSKDNWVSAVINQGEPILIADTHHDERVPLFMRQTQALALILAPLQAEGRVLGILAMARPMAEKFDLDEVALSVSIVNQVGVAVHTEQLRQLVQQARVLEERQRLARDLHDSVTQSLYGLVTLTEVGLMQVETRNLEHSQDIFKKIGQSARQAIREMRLFIHQLRLPELEQEGLINALDLRLAAVEGRSDVRAQLIADESIHLPLTIETALYHIAQEALNNALKHARAKSVIVTLARRPEGVIMEVVDDGRGFIRQQNAGGGMGLDNMQARAGEIGAALEIISQPGYGTRVSVHLEVQA
jgi:signal transduction histidine kinase